MSNKYRICLVAFILLYGILTSFENSNSSEVNIDIYQAIELAKKKLSADGIDLGNLEIIKAEKYRVARNELTNNDTSKYMQDLLSKLKNKTYWLILFTKKHLVLGGGIGVFIDANTKEIIHIYKGK
jgi:hypothetical protein